MDKNKIKKSVSGMIGGLFLGALILMHPVVPAKAVIVYDPTHTALTNTRGIIEQAFGKLNEYANTFSASIASKEWIQNLYEKRLLPILKQMAIQKVNDMTTTVVTGGNAGKPYLVTDWNQYLISGPEDEARVYVNSMLNNSLRGRASGSDYSNSEYPSYLFRQAQESITPRPIDTTISHSGGNPKNAMFAEGNLKSFNEFMSVGKNPYSLSLIAEDAFEKRTENNRLIAQKEAVNGYLPKKDEFGRIMTPASVFENAMNSASNMGREMVVNATRTDELLGAVVNFIVQTAMKPLKSGLVNVGR